MLHISGANSDPGSRVHPPVLLAAGQPGRCPPQPSAHPLTLPHRLPPPGILYTYCICTLLEKFWRISLYVTDDVNAKLSVTSNRGK